MSDIWIGGLKIIGVETSCTVAFGPSMVVGANSASKQMSANGVVYGDNGAMPATTALIHDSDWLDAPMWMIKEGWA